MKSTTIEKKTEIDTQETFFFYPQQSLLQEFEMNSSTSQTSHSKKDDLTS